MVAPFSFAASDPHTSSNLPAPAPLVILSNVSPDLVRCPERKVVEDQDASQFSQLLLSSIPLSLPLERFRAPGPAAGSLPRARLRATGVLRRPVDCFVLVDNVLGVLES